MPQNNPDKCYSSFDLDIFKIGYFIVYKGNGEFFSREITKTQISAGIPADAALYSHVEVSIGGPWSVGALLGGTQVIEITKKHSGRYAKLMRPKLDDYAIRRYKVAIWAATRCNLPYSFLGVLWFKIKKFGIKKNIGAALGDFCSELSAWALIREYLTPQVQSCAMQSKINILPKAPAEMMPGHFLDERYFECAWEGIIPKAS